MEELIDILDERGNNTGEKKTKPEAHSKGLWHRAVHVWIVNSRNEILLQRRGETLINYPNTWDISAAGHVSSGEDTTTAALRETQEELGLSLDTQDLQKIGETKVQTILNNNTYFDYEFDTIFLVRLDVDIKDLKMQAREVKDLQYVPAQDFKEWIYGDKKDLVVPHPEEYKLLFDAIGGV